MQRRGQDLRGRRERRDELHRTIGLLITLAMDEAQEDSIGSVVRIKLKDKIRGVRVREESVDILPNQLEAELPAAGRYRIILNHRGFFKTDGFKGDYCLTVHSTGDAARTLARTGSVE